MKRRVAELNAVQLNFITANILNKTVRHSAYCLDEHGDIWEPSTNWGQAGPIIESEKISITVSESDVEWNAEYSFKLFTDDEYWSDKTPLIAAMRCFVASRFGDTVEIPDDLCYVT